MTQCRFCSSGLEFCFADLGLSPVSNSFIAMKERYKPEVFYPLTVFTCGNCFLVQALDIESAGHHFHGNYIYFSSFSDAWIAHARDFVEKIIPLRGLNKSSLVVEVASNDGYLLQHFLPHSIPVLGIEPSANVAEAAEKKGVRSLVKFFGTSTATQLVSEGKKADLVVANNVLAHVPDIRDFISGISIILKENGIASIEFPWLLSLIEKNQFDTIYHEHYSYLSITFLQKAFAKNGLELFNIEKIPTHGGSLRVFVKHATNPVDLIDPSVAEILSEEARAGFSKLESYGSFQNQMELVKLDLLDFLIDIKRKGKKIVGYGAPAKGNTLLNYCGVGPELLAFTVDRSPHKQGKLLPGTRIPVKAVQAIYEEKPDYILILPWNLKEEVMDQMKEVRVWGCRFVVPIPRVEELI